MKFVPRTHQDRFIRAVVETPIIHHGGLMSPGLGKTAATLLALLELDAFPALVIAPLQVCYSTWTGEIEKWSQFRGLRTSILHGTQKTAKRKEDADLYLINPEGLPWLFGRPDEKRTKWLPGRWQAWKGRPETLVVDESTKFKKTSAARTKTLKRFLPDFERRYILTGTPIPNGMLDIHGQMLILDRGEALDYRVTYFQRKYFDAIPIANTRRRKFELKDGAFDQILDKIRPMVTTLLAEDWLDLPDLITTTVPVTLPAAARRVYEEVREHGTIEDRDMVMDSDSAMNKCRQISNGAFYTEEGSTVQLHAAKDDALIELLDQIGEPTMLLYEFRHDLDRLRQKLAGRKVGIIGGPAGTRDSAKAIEDWNAGKLDVLLTHPQAGGIGLNLQAGGCHQIWYSPPWNLEHYLQTVARLHRQGQDKAVMVYLLACINTIDQQVAKVLNAKGASQEDMMKALKEETP